MHCSLKEAQNHFAADLQKKGLNRTKFDMLSFQGCLIKTVLSQVEGSIFPQTDPQIEPRTFKHYTHSYNIYIEHLLSEF